MPLVEANKVVEIPTFSNSTTNSLSFTECPSSANPLDIGLLSASAGYLIDGAQV